MMGNFSIELPVTFSYVCPDCRQEIPHNYTHEVVMSTAYLDFTCACGFSRKVPTAELIEQARERAINEFKSLF